MNKKGLNQCAISFRIVASGGEKNIVIKEDGVEVILERLSLRCRGSRRRRGEQNDALLLYIHTYMLMCGCNRTEQSMRDV